MVISKPLKIFFKSFICFVFLPLITPIVSINLLIGVIGSDISLKPCGLYLELV